MEIVPLREISLKFSSAHGHKEGNRSSRKAFIKECGVQSEGETGTRQWDGLPAPSGQRQSQEDTGAKPKVTPSQGESISGDHRLAGGGGSVGFQIKTPGLENLTQFVS